MQAASAARGHWPSTPTGTQPALGFLWSDFNINRGQAFSFSRGRGPAFGEAVTRRWLKRAGIVAIVRAHQHNNNPVAGPMLKRLQQAGGVVDAWPGSSGQQQGGDTSGGTVFTFISGSEIPGLGLHFDSHGLFLMEEQDPSTWRPLHCQQAVPGAMLHTNGQWYGGKPRKHREQEQATDGADDSNTSQGAAADPGSQGSDPEPSMGSDNDDDDDEGDDDPGRPPLDPEYTPSDSAAYEAELEAARELELENKEWRDRHSGGTGPEDPESMQVQPVTSQRRGGESGRGRGRGRGRGGDGMGAAGLGGGMAPQLAASDEASTGGFLPPGQLVPSGGTGGGAGSAWSEHLLQSWSSWRSGGQAGIREPSRTFVRDYDPKVMRSCHPDHALVCRALPWLGNNPKMPVALAQTLVELAETEWKVLEAQEQDQEQKQPEGTGGAARDTKPMGMAVLFPQPGEVIRATRPPRVHEDTGAVLLDQDEQVPASGALHLTIRLNGRGEGIGTNGTAEAAASADAEVNPREPSVPPTVCVYLYKLRSAGLAAVMSGFRTPSHIRRWTWALGGDEDEESPVGNGAERMNSSEVQGTALGAMAA